MSASFELVKAPRATFFFNKEKSGCGAGMIGYAIRPNVALVSKPSADSTKLCASADSPNVQVVSDSLNTHTLIRRAGQENGFTVLSRNAQDPVESLIVVVDLSLPESALRKILISSNAAAFAPMIVAVAPWDFLAENDLRLSFPSDDVLLFPAKEGELVFRFKRYFQLVRAFELKQQNAANSDNVVTLNAQSHSLRFKRKNLELTKREFELVSYLMRKPGVSISRLEIETVVWRHKLPTQGFDNALNVYLVRLRKKLRDVQCESCLVTDRGCGIAFFPTPTEKNGS
jgi:DNA-binding response OmpR family regulator